MMHTDPAARRMRAGRESRAYPELRSQWHRELALGKRPHIIGRRLTVLCCRLLAASTCLQLLLVIAP